jgi:nitroreductase
MDLNETIKNRRSIRKYKTDPVDDQTLTIVLEAARLAPSWANTQCWKFVIVRDSAIRAQLAGTMSGIGGTAPNPSAEGVRNAPVTIVACAEKGTSGYYGGKPSTDKGDGWLLFDVALAMEHVALTAFSLGLGTVHIGLFDAQKVAAILGVPENFIVVEIMPLGYPEFQPNARPRKDLKDIVFYEKFGRK